MPIRRLLRQSTVHSFPMDYGQVHNLKGLNLKFSDIGRLRREGVRQPLDYLLAAGKLRPPLGVRPQEFIQAFT